MKMADQSTSSAIVAALAPICVVIRHATEAKATLAELKLVDSWKRDSFIEKGGWATFPGATLPRNRRGSVRRDAQRVEIATHLKNSGRTREQLEAASIGGFFHFKLSAQRLLLAQSRHRLVHCTCLLFYPKRTRFRSRRYRADYQPLHFP